MCGYCARLHLCIIFPCQCPSEVVTIIIPIV